MKFIKKEILTVKVEGGIKELKRHNKRVVSQVKKLKWRSNDLYKMVDNLLG
jgi:hypothetical protein